MVRPILSPVETSFFSLEVAIQKSDRSIPFLAHSQQVVQALVAVAALSG